MLAPEQWWLTGRKNTNNFNKVSFCTIYVSFCSQNLRKPFLRGVVSSFALQYVAQFSLYQECNILRSRPAVHREIETNVVALSAATSMALTMDSMASPTPFHDLSDSSQL